MHLSVLTGSQSGLKPAQIPLAFNPLIVSVALPKKFF
jgi:hypothetical protein